VLEGRAVVCVGGLDVSCVKMGDQRLEANDFPTLPMPYDLTATQLLCDTVCGQLV
jgi:hypothetical protein